MRMVMERLFGIFAAAAILAFQAAPSQAQSTQTFVRSDGNDTLTCATFATRCLSLGRGILNVVQRGTVNLLDSNVHDAVQIEKELTILSEGGGNAIVSSGIGTPTSGIWINMPSGNDILTIRGMTVDEGGHALVHGITFIGAGTFHLQNCFIRGSGDGFGINFIPTGVSELHVSNCVIGDNAPNGATGGGILIKPSGAASVKVVLENVTIENNLVGIQIDGRSTTGSNTVTLRDSTIGGSPTYGLFAVDSGGGTTDVMVEGSTFASNGSFGVGANGVNATVRMRDSTVSGNANGLIAAAASKIISQGGNVVAGNTTNGAFTQTLPQQ